MAAKVLRRSFAGGEVDPEVYGRIDLGHIQTGLAIARNIITSQHGPAFNRAGFKYILETKDSTKASVLLPFSFNDEQTYVLEFGDQYIRFHTNGGTLLTATQAITGITQADPGVVTYSGTDPVNGDWVYIDSVGGMTQVNGRYFKVANVNAGANTFELTSIHGGADIDTTGYGAYTAGGTFAKVYEIASPYLEADLFELHIAQSADVLTITHPDYAPRELSRLAAASWTLAEIEFVGGPFLDPYREKRQYVWTLDKSGAMPVVTLNDGTTGEISLYSDDDIFEAEDVGRLFRIAQWEYEGGSSYSAWDTGLVYGKLGGVRHGDNYYEAVEAGTTGNVAPTHTSGVRKDGNPGVKWRYSHNGFGVVKIIEFVSVNEVKAEVQLELPRVIQYGYINAGATAHTATTTWNLSGTGSQTRFAIVGATSENPAKYRVTIADVFAGTSERQIPHEEYMVDAAGDNIDFFVPPPAGVNNILVEEFASALITTDFAFGAWGAEPGYPGCVSYFGGRLAYGGSEEEPQNVWLSKSGNYKDFGVSVPALDSDAIDVSFADRQVNRVRDLVALKHLVALTSSRAWHLVGDVDNVLTPTATAEPGDAVGISLVQAEVANSHGLYVDAVGNAIHRLYYGALPTGESGYLSEDLSILAEHLTRNKTIVDIAFQRKPVPILWCVRSDGYLLGLTYNARHEVVGWHQHTTDGEFESVAVVNEGVEDAVYCIVKRTINGRTVRYVERMASRRFVTLADCFFVDAGLSYEGAANDEITGFWHLEGETVVGLMDGAVFSKVVTDGTITLDAEASKVHAGLGYVADMQTLPLSIEIRDVGAGAQGTTKNVNAVHLRLIDSSGVKAGPDEDHLDELLQREDEVYGAAPNVVNGLRRVPIDGTWTEDGQVYIRQENPLPLHVSQLVLEVAVGG